jgi:KUP system potassium uptake protein
MPALIVVMLKYVWYVMRADNEREGGIIALSALVESG